MSARNQPMNEAINLLDTKMKEAGVDEEHREEMYALVVKAVVDARRTTERDFRSQIEEMKEEHEQAFIQLRELSGTVPNESVHDFNGLRWLGLGIVVGALVMTATGMLLWSGPF